MSKFFAEILVENGKLTLTGWLVTIAVLLSVFNFAVEVVKWVA
jgi:hypothetical protein